MSYPLIMETRAGEFLKRTLIALLSSPLMLTRLFSHANDDAGDIESQTTPDLLTHKHTSATHHSKDLKGSGSSLTLQSICSISIRDSYRDDGVQTDAFNTGDPGPHTNVNLIVTEEMVWSVQKIVDDRQELEQHKKQYDFLEHQILYLESSIDNVTQDIATADNEDETVNLQEEINRLHTDLENTQKQRDELGGRLKIFKSNVDFARDNSHDIVQDLLCKAGLLNIPAPEDQEARTPSETDDGPYQRSRSMKDPTRSPEEIFRQETLDKLDAAWQELEEAQNLFDNRKAKYDADEAEYTECIACGRDDTTRSNFDRMFVTYLRDLTTHLIERENDYENQKANAIDLGFIRPDWGTPSEYEDDDSVSIASDSPELAVQRALEQDYTTEHNWLQTISCHLDEATWEPMDIEIRDGEESGFEKVASPEPVGMEYWKATKVKMSDSTSVVGDILDSPMRKHVQRWREMNEVTRQEFVNRDDDVSPMIIDDDTSNAS